MPLFTNTTADPIDIGTGGMSAIRVNPGQSVDIPDELAPGLAGNPAFAAATATGTASAPVVTAPAAQPAPDPTPDSAPTPDDNPAADPAPQD